MIFLPGKDYSLDLDKIVSGMGGWYGEDEDPCYSMFVSQDQIWNLNPILKVLADEGSILAKELGYDMNSYVSDNGYTIYNPYLSWINHYYHYCPTFNEDKLKPWDRVEDRKNKFKMTDKVKRGANNWYYSGGTISCVDSFLGKKYRKNLRTFIYRGIVFFLDRIWHTSLFDRMGVKMKYNAYYCYAATSGIWYDKGFKRRLAKRFNRSLSGGGEPVEIDSALVSAQTRHRLYWCNWPVEMPKDKHISLDDILEHDKGWNPGAIRGRYIGTIVGRRIGEDGYRKDCDMGIKITQCLEIRKDKNTTPIKKSNCLTTVMKDNVISSLPPGRYPNAFDMKDKFRYLTPVEMCRLQTLPDDYLDGIAPNTAMSLAGNGWTVDVIAHLLRSIERKQINDIVKEFRKITDELMFGSLETDIM